MRGEVDGWKEGYFSDRWPDGGEESWQKTEEYGCAIEVGRLVRRYVVKNASFVAVAC